MYKCLKCGNTESFEEVRMATQVIECDEKGGADIISTEITDFMLDVMCMECESNASDDDVVYVDGEKISLYTF